MSDLRTNAEVSAKAIGLLVAESLAAAASSTRLDAHITPSARRPRDQPSGNPTSTFSRWRVVLSGLAAMLIFTVLVSTQDGQAVTAAFLAQFRGQRLAVVTFDSAQSRSPFLELERLGAVRGDTRGRRPEEVKTIAEASQRAGFQVKQPDVTLLPTGVDRTPKIMVAAASEVRFTFDREKARAYLQSGGHPEISLPDKFHGVTLTVAMPATVLLQYAGNGKELSLGVAQAGQLTAGVDGAVSLDELREFLLGLPNVPANVAQQLRGMKDWKTTLPIPIPLDKVSWQPTTVNGDAGLLLADNSGLGSAVIWERNGLVHGVVGPGKAADIQRVANSLR